MNGDTMVRFDADEFVDGCTKFEVYNVVLTDGMRDKAREQRISCSFDNFDDAVRRAYELSVLEAYKADNDGVLLNATDVRFFDDAAVGFTLVKVSAEHGTIITSTYRVRKVSCIVTEY